VAVENLQSPTFDGFTERLLLGPRDYTFRQAATILGASIGKPGFPYVDVPQAAVRAGMLAAGMSDTAVDAIQQMTDAMNDGRTQRGLVRNASSTTPTTLETFASEVFAPAYDRAKGVTQPA
jgi:hypothetical protein